LLFGLGRALLVPTLLKLPLVGQLFRPFLGHVTSRRSEWTLLLPLRHLGLLLRTYALGTTTVATWEIAETLFDGIGAEVRPLPLSYYLLFLTAHNQPISIYHATADPALALIAGTMSADPAGYFRRFAYAELRQLAQDDSPAARAARTALFADQKHSPSAWAALCRASLVLLGQDYGLLLRRGRPAPAPAPLAALVAAAAPTRAPGTPLKKGAIFKSARQSPIRAVVESLASDGTVSQAVVETEERLRLPDLFRSVRGAELVTAGVEDVVAAKEKVVETVGVPDVKAAVAGAAGKGKVVVRSWMPRWAVALGDEIGVWWTSERASRMVECSLPNRDLDAIVVDGE
jgi:nucleoporin NDC1